ncbi:unnamed protein product [Musa textilis]
MATVKVFGSPTTAESCRGGGIVALPLHRRLSSSSLASTTTGARDDFPNAAPSSRGSRRCTGGGRRSRAGRRGRGWCRCSRSLPRSSKRLWFLPLRDESAGLRTNCVSTMSLCPSSRVHVGVCLAA